MWIGLWLFVMCVGEFLLLTKPLEQKDHFTEAIVAFVVMLVAGYDLVWDFQVIGQQYACWGNYLYAGIVYIVYEVICGDIALSLLRILIGPAWVEQCSFGKIFITLGLVSIYPIGYMVLPGNLLSGCWSKFYWLVLQHADAVNKNWFSV